MSLSGFRSTTLSCCLHRFFIILNTLFYPWFVCNFRKGYIFVKDSFNITVLNNKEFLASSRWLVKEEEKSSRPISSSMKNSVIMGSKCRKAECWNLPVKSRYCSGWLSWSTPIRLRTRLSCNCRSDSTAVRGCLAARIAVRSCSVTVPLLVDYSALVLDAGPSGPRFSGRFGWSRAASVWLFVCSVLSLLVADSGRQS